MLRLVTLFQVVLLVIVALASSVHGLGLQAPSFTHGLVQGAHDTEHAVLNGAGVEDGVSGLSGPRRDLLSYWGSPECKRKCRRCPKCMSCKRCKTKKVPKAKKAKKVTVFKPKKTIIVVKPKKKFIFKKKPSHKKLFKK